MEFEIEGRKIGSGYPPYIIAELSCNHNNDLERGLLLIEKAKRAGVDAIKFQTYTADTISFNSDRPEFQIHGGLWDGRTLYDLYDEAHTPWEWHEALFAKAREVGLTAFSSPFDLTAIDFLENNFDPPAYKIASFEMIDLPLIQKAAATGKPLFMSTGMSSDEEIDEAVTTAREAGCEDLVLFHCVSGYPTAVEDVNLRVMPTLQEKYGVLTGLSDHTLTTVTSVGATALGAAVIEKHFILDRSEGGLDAEFSIEPEEMSVLVRDCQNVFNALGVATRAIQPSEKTSVGKRRSLYVVEAIKKGEEFTSQNVRSIRPEVGLKPKHYFDVLGRKASRDIERGQPLSLDMLASPE
ncbi:pseudaminic acid synthase [Pseudomonadota bacterium]